MLTSATTCGRQVHSQESKPATSDTFAARDRPGKQRAPLLTNSQSVVHGRIVPDLEIKRQIPTKWPSYDLMIRCYGCGDQTRSRSTGWPVMAATRS